MANALEISSVSNGALFTVDDTGDTVVAGDLEVGGAIVAANAVPEMSGATSGLLLTNDGTTPAWTTLGGHYSAIVTASVDPTDPTDDTIYILTAASDWSFSLPSAATIGAGVRVGFWLGTSSYTVTVTPSGSETIDGASTLAVTSDSYYEITSDGTNWIVTGGNASGGVTDAADLTVDDASFTVISGTDGQAVLDSIDDEFASLGTAAYVDTGDFDASGSAAAVAAAVAADLAALTAADLGVEIGVDVQAYDAGLQSISGLTTAADQMIYATGSDTYAVTSLTSFARTILDDADAASARTTLGITDAPVTSVAGKTGVVTLASSDLTDVTAIGTSVVSAADAEAIREILELGVNDTATFANIVVADLFADSLETETVLLKRSTYTVEIQAVGTLTEHRSLQIDVDDGDRTLHMAGSLDVNSPSTIEGTNTGNVSVDGGSSDFASITGTGQVLSIAGGVANGLATLDGAGKLPAAQLPDLAVTEYLGETASEAAMLALSGEYGDWTVRTDAGTVWIIVGADPSVIGGWKEMVYPGAPVTSVAGRTGTVTLTDADIAGLGTAATGDVGTDVQAHDSLLDNLVSVFSIISAGAVPYANGSGGWSSFASSTFGRDWAGITTAGFGRNALGLGDLAVKNNVGTADIQTDAVTYDILQDVSTTNRILGRKTAGAGNVEELTPAEVRTVVGVDAQGPAVALSLGTSVLDHGNNFTGQSVIRAIPYGGRVIPIYDGTSWVPTPLTGSVSYSLSGLTTGSQYDLFLWLNGSTLTLTRGPAWSVNTHGSSVRGTGAGTTELDSVDGLPVNKVAISGGPAAGRGLWLGTFEAASSTTTSSNAGNRLLWSMYNQIDREITVAGTTSHSYTTAAWRYWGNSSANRINIVSGLSGRTANLTCTGRMFPSVDGRYAAIGVGLNSSTVPYSQAVTSIAQDADAGCTGAVALSLGRSYLAAVENSASGASVTYSSIFLRGTFRC